MKVLIATNLSCQIGAKKSTGLNVGFEILNWQKSTIENIVLENLDIASKYM